jgi:adenosylmethionine-8-amino-7-oxononanoate aminotransferase
MEETEAHLHLLQTLDQLAAAAALEELELLEEEQILAEEPEELECKTI